MVFLINIPDPRGCSKCIFKLFLFSLKLFYKIQYYFRIDIIKHLFKYDKFMFMYYYFYKVLIKIRNNNYFSI